MDLIGDAVTDLIQSRCFCVTSWVLVTDGSMHASAFIIKFWLTERHSAVLSRKNCVQRHTGYLIDPKNKAHTSPIARTFINVLAATRSNLAITKT